MRAWVLIGVVAGLGGCVEVYEGPRVVQYNPDWFYVRHAPLINGRGEVDRLATGLCPDAARPAQLVDSAQYYSFDLRDATYRCTSPAPKATSSPVPEPPAPTEG